MTIMVPPTRLLPPCSPKWATRRRPERETFGPELARIAAALGQPFMPWQSAAADVGCEIDPATGLPAYREVIITVPRQHGKTTLYLSWQINRCVSPRWSQPQRSAFTAQSGKDARDKWLDELFPLIRRSRALRPLVARIYEGMGNEYIRFTNGSLIRLLSTSTSSGHSKTLHQAVLDEIWHDADGRREQGLRPAMITVSDAQLLVCSTAGTDASVVLDRKVIQGREAVKADTGHGTAYIEYSAPDGWDPDDGDSYLGFMPALCPAPPCRCGGGKWRHTITMDAIWGERESMQDADFRRAYGNIPDRASSTSALVRFREAWPLRADTGSQVTDPVALAFSMLPGGGGACIAVGGRRADGLGHGELAEPPRDGTEWLLGRLLELWDRWQPCALVINPAGAARALEKDLIEHGFSTKPDAGQRRLQMTGMTEYAGACGALAADVINGQWRHLGQPPADEAVLVAATRALGAAGAWAWRASGPLEALTLARHGYMTHGISAGAFFGSWR